MRIENLKNVGTYSGAQSVRAAVARAISFAEITTKSRPDATPSGFSVNLAAFLYDAATKTPGFEAPASVSAGDAVDLYNGDTKLAAGNGTTVRSVDGKLSVTLPTSAYLVGNNDAVKVLNSAGTNLLSASVTISAAGVLSGVKLPATVGVITKATDIPVEGGTVKLTVDKNVIKATFVPTAG